jgi:lipoate-protein ligase A
MSVPLRIIDTGEMPARWNVAMTAVQSELHRTGRIPNTLRFHRYPHSILIGRHQVLSRAVHVESCEAAQVELARRVTGGGAVYMAPGALAWDLVISRRTIAFQRRPAAAAIGEAVAAGLSRLGLCARYRAENEVEIAGRKVCGMSGYFDGGTLVCQGTVLADASLVDMARLLRFPTKAAETTYRNLSERLMNVKEILGREPDRGEIESAVSAGLSHVLGCMPAHEEPTGDELKLADDWHRAEFGLESFVDGIKPDTKAKTMVGRDGQVDVYIKLFPGAERLIDQIWLTGNFSVSPSRFIPDLEAALRGTPIVSAADKVIEALSGAQIEIRGASRYEVAAAIAKAKEPRIYSPRRPR